MKNIEFFSECAKIMLQQKISKREEKLNDTALILNV